MILDAHSHILPRIDDGAGSEAESLRLLKMLKAQGVTAVLATPHFYNRRHDAAQYTLKVKTTLEKLKKTVTSPEIYLGFEVNYFSGMANAPYLKDLTLGGTNYLLLELSWAGITDAAIDEISHIKQNCGITPILAHIERYSYYANYHKALSLIEKGYALAQLNADSVLTGVNKSEAIRLANLGFYSALGSDTHSVDGRPPRIGEFYKQAPGLINEAALKKIEAFSSQILDDIKSISANNK